MHIIKAFNFFEPSIYDIPEEGTFQEVKRDSKNYRKSPIHQPIYDILEVSTLREVERDSGNHRKPVIYQPIYDIPEEGTLREVENLFKRWRITQNERSECPIYQVFSFFEIVCINKEDNMNFKKIEEKDLLINPVTMFAEDWPLLASGDEEDNYNTMTIAWGHIGAVWNKSAITIYVRPQRYTKEFTDRNELFTVSVLPSSYKDALLYLGKTSGRDEDKVLKAGITPIFDQNTTYFEEAELVFICQTLSSAD